MSCAISTMPRLLTKGLGLPGPAYVALGMNCTANAQPGLVCDSAKGKKELLNGMKKYYATDVGLRSNLSEVIEYDDSFALENIIYNELVFRGYTVKYGIFKKVGDNSPKFVMTLDKKDTSHDGITHLNIIDFLTGNINITLS